MIGRGSGKGRQRQQACRQTCCQNGKFHWLLSLSEFIFKPSKPSLPPGGGLSMAIDPRRVCSVFLHLRFVRLHQLLLDLSRNRVVVAEFDGVAALASGHGFEFGLIVADFR